MNKQLVDIKKLDFYYFNKQILFDVNINIKENEKILLIGLNGAGKSTLLRVIAGLHYAYDFSEFNVLDSDRPNDQFNGLAYLGNRWFKNISFVGNTPYSCDIFVKDMMKKLQQENVTRRDELVDVLEINLDWKMHTVSDGQRKRVQIMLALLKPFKLLIIDEFLSELDIIIRDKLFEYLTKECNLRNASIIYATHIFDNLESWIDNVIYISNGRCSQKEDLNTFLVKKNLYLSVKNKLLTDCNRKLEDFQEVDESLFGKQGGYSSGRLII